MQIIEQSTERRVLHAIGRALQLQDASSSGLRLGMTPGWDSLRHMRVVIELEREFNVTFPVHRIADLVDVPSAVNAVKEAIART